MLESESMLILYITPRHRKMPVDPWHIHPLQFTCLRQGVPMFSQHSVSRVAYTLAFLVAAFLSDGARALAQMSPMGIPINTTLVISKPGPEEMFGNKQIVTLGVGTKQYRFVLDDAYVDNAGGHTRWPDVWEYVRTHRPNFVVQGQNSDTFEKIQPGQMVTIKGVFAPLDRTFEVMDVQPGKGPFEPQKTY